VLFRRLRDLGLLFLLLAGIAACTHAETPPAAPRIDVAVQAYTPPSTAPGFCAGLADSSQLPQLPEAVGTLIAEPGEVEASLVLTGAITELEGLLDDIREGPGFVALDRSADALVTTLRSARDGRLTEMVRIAITEGLDDVGRRVQAVCDFPT
jgi:hypothetical protein